MVNVKRAVSPLIATILLVALTVSIGAMIIGWGRQYVQQQTSCLGLSLYIADYEVNQNTFKLIVQNTGRAIDLNKEKLIVYIKGNSIDIKECKLSNDPNSNDCIIENLNDQPYQSVGVSKITEGDYFKLELEGYSSTNKPKLIHIEIKGCGTVSNELHIV